MIAFFDSVAFEALPYVLLALALVLTHRYLGLIDLTFAATFSGAPAVAAALLVSGAPFLVALGAAGVYAILAALLTLATMRFLMLDGLLASLLTSLAGFAVALLFTQGTLALGGVVTPFSALQDIDFQFLQDGLALHPVQIATFAVIVIVAKVAVDVLLRSELGLSLRAMEDVQSRDTLLAALGISRWRLTTLAIVLGNLLSGAAGLLVMLREGQVTASRGFDAVVTVIAAYLLGVVLFERRAWRTPATLPSTRALRGLARFSATTAAMLGVLLYFLLLAAVLRLDLPASTPKLLLVGLVLAAFGLRHALDADPSQVGGIRVVRSGPRQDVIVRGVSVSYAGPDGPRHILRDVSLTVHSGMVSQLVGPNGSGKSTLLKALAGRIAATGEVELPKAPDAGETPIAYVSQDPTVASSAHLTVSENLALFARGRKARWWRRWRPVPLDAMSPPIRKLSSDLGALPAGWLSGGQRQALGVSAFQLGLETPQVLLFDEPLTHLDEANALAYVDMLSGLLDSGKTVLLVQHDIAPDLGRGPSAAREALAKLVTTRLDINDLKSNGRGDIAG